MVRLGVTFLMVLSLPLFGGDAPGSKPFDASWESLDRYECPEWFRDAKLGVFVCWNLHSLQGVDDWYGRHMYVEGHKAYEHHVKAYGHPSVFGFKDFIPMWKGEHFDADDLTRRFKEAGAKYVVPIATYHDNFDCWDSKHHRWNSVRMGPKKDIIGMWRAAADKHGLRFGVTTHLARSWSWLQPAHGADTKGRFKGVPYDGADPANRGFYHPFHGEDVNHYPVGAPPAWKTQWMARIKDLCGQHHPDLLYFDGGLPFPDDDGLPGREVAAWYYNQNRRWNGGRLEAVLNVKKWPLRKNHGPFRAGMCVRDMEKGLLEGIQPHPWQNDTTVSSWFHRPDEPVRPVNSTVDMLVDIVSKNGNLLLNIPPRADGTLDAAHREHLAGLGRWMKINGEALYATRPWKQFGEGPTAVLEGHMNDRQLGLGAEDIRFTSSKDGGTLYAIFMDWPGDDAEVVIRALGREGAGRAIKQVVLLGHDDTLDWHQGKMALQVRLPARSPCDHAVSLKVAWE